MIWCPRRIAPKIYTSYSGTALKQDTHSTVIDNSRHKMCKANSRPMLQCKDFCKPVSQSGRVRQRVTLGEGCLCHLLADILMAAHIPPHLDERDIADLCDGITTLWSQRSTPADSKLYGSDLLWSSSLPWATDGVRVGPLDVTGGSRPHAPTVTGSALTK
jgi:hypothetical protein